MQSRNAPSSMGNLRKMRGLWFVKLDTYLVMTLAYLHCYHKQQVIFHQICNSFYADSMLYWCLVSPNLKNHPTEAPFQMMEIPNFQSLKRILEHRPKRKCINIEHFLSSYHIFFAMKLLIFYCEHLQDISENP